MNRFSPLLNGLALLVLTIALGVINSVSANEAASPPDGPSTGRTATSEDTSNVDALAVKTNIELWEQRVNQKMEHINQILKGVDLRTLEGQKLAKEAMIELLDDLADQAGAIIAAHGELGPDLRLYREALLKAPEVFGKISEKMAAKANTTASPLLKAAYADLSSEARQLGSTFGQRAKSVDGVEREMSEKMSLVYESQVFISDARELLNAIPTDHGFESEKLLNQLNKYISTMQDAINALKGVTKKIGEDGKPSSKPYQPEQAGAPAPTGPTLTLKEYGRTVSDLRR
jgi:hypothetical protein